MNNDNNSPLTTPPLNEVTVETLETPQVDLSIDQKKPRSKNLINLFRFLLVGGGLFIVFVVGLGISFSACFTMKGPPPPECGPVSFVSLIVMPAASLLFLVPIAKKIK